MKNNMRPVCLISLGAILLCGPFSSGQSRKKASDAPAVDLSRPLIRKDLLKCPEGDAPPPLRDIFAPMTFSRQEAPAAAPSAAPAREETQRHDLSSDGSVQAEAEPVPPSIDLLYIGYIQSAQKRIGLIVFEGQPMAVAEGEQISPDIRVAKVTEAQIEIIGPDTQKTSFSLQGEE